MFSKNNLLTFVFFFFILQFFINTDFKNKLAEFFFLTYNQNTLALEILNIFENKYNQNYYTHFLKGRIYFVQGQLSESIENYSQAILENPNHKESYYGRGLAYGFVEGKFLDYAEADFKKYIEFENLDFLKTGIRAYGAWAGYNDLAWIYFLKNDFVNQEKVSREGLSFSNTNPWLLNSLGVSLLSQKKCKLAQPYLENAKKYINETSIDEFGEAYSGDKKHFWEKGLLDMQKIIVDNIETCTK